MLSLRVSVPESLTDAVVRALEDDSWVTGLAVLRGASLRPAGDLVLADLAREGANPVVDALRELGVHEVGTIRLDPVGTWLSQDAYVAEKHAPGAGADAVVWTEVEHQAYEDSELNWVYLSFMTLATLIAGVAIVADNLVLVVGAMVLGPEFGPIAAIGLGLVTRRLHLLGLAVRTLLAGFAVALVVTWLAALAGRTLGWVTLDEVVRERTLTTFVARPDHWSLVIAVIAGAAGVLSLTSGRTRGLSGVFISVVTVPAAGNIAVAAAVGAWEQVSSAGAQLGINLAGMAVAGWATLVVQREVWSRVQVRRPSMIGRPPL